MGPERKRYWIPLVRLSAFFCAVVVGGNLLLQAFYSPPAHANRVGRDRDYFSHKKRQIKRHYLKLRRFIQDFTTAPKPAPSSSEEIPARKPVVMMMAAEEAWVPQETAVAVAPEPPQAAMQLEGPLYVPLSEPASTTFAWPEPLPARPVRTVDRLPETSEYHFPVITREAVEELEARGDTSPIIEIGNGLLMGPELLFDGVLSLAGDVTSSRRKVRVWTTEKEESGLADRMLDFTIEPRQGHIFSEFLGHLAKREMSYWSKFGDSDLNTAAVQDGQADLDPDDVASDQGKLVWDALRKTYFSKYKFRAEKTLKDDAFHFNTWRGVDFLLLPPLMTGYVYYRGIEKKFSISGSRLRVELEPIAKWRDRDFMVAGASLHWTPTKNFPIGVIVTAGLYDGDPEVDFIGIGTSTGMARRALLLQYGE